MSEERVEEKFSSMQAKMNPSWKDWVFWIIQLAGIFLAFNANIYLGFTVLYLWIGAKLVVKAKPENVKEGFITLILWAPIIIWKLVK